MDRGLNTSWQVVSELIQRNKVGIDHPLFGNYFENANSFNKCFNEEVNLKITNKPCIKQGDSNSFYIYRSIILLNVFSKFFELIVYEKSSQFFRVKNFLIQDNIFPGKSNVIYNCFETANGSYGIFLDFI